MKPKMNRPSGHDFDQDLARALAQGRVRPIPGFAERVLLAVGVARRRRALIRWASGLTTAAACLLAVLTLAGRSEDALAQRARALAASDESSQLNDLLGLADELAVLSPVVDRHTVVEVLINPDL
jgi:hypothetical protein